MIVESHYQFDGALFDGNINIEEPLDISSVGEHTYYVNNISDRHGMTIFDSTNVTCIWDQVEIVEGGHSADESTIRQPVEIWYKAVYAYDNSEFGPNDGQLFVNWEPCEWDNVNERWTISVNSNKEGILSYSLTKIVDNRYGLTVFDDSIGVISVDWLQKPSIIPPDTLRTVAIGIISVIMLVFFSRTAWISRIA